MSLARGEAPRLTQADEDDDATGREGIVVAIVEEEGEVETEERKGGKQGVGNVKREGKVGRKDNT